MAIQHSTGVTEASKFNVAAAMVLAKASQPGFWAEGLALESNPIIDCYLREWWPAFYREVTNLAGAASAGQGDDLLEPWIADNEDKIATLAFLEDSVDPGPLTQARDDQVHRWMECALAGYRKPSEAELETFIAHWVPTMLRETFSQIRQVGRLLDELIAAHNTTIPVEPATH